MVLMLLGLGFGAWAINLCESNPADGLPTGAAIWTGVSMLIAAFTGGYVTSRLSGTYRRSDGLYHGIVVWGVNWLVFAWLTTTAMAAMTVEDTVGLPEWPIFEARGSGETFRDLRRAG